MPVIRPGVPSFRSGKRVTALNGRRRPGIPATHRGALSMGRGCAPLVSGGSQTSSKVQGLILLPARHQQAARGAARAIKPRASSAVRCTRAKPNYAVVKATIRGDGPHVSGRTQRDAGAAAGGDHGRQRRSRDLWRARGTQQSSCALDAGARAAPARSLRRLHGEPRALR